MWTEEANTATQPNFDCTLMGFGKYESDTIGLIFCLSDAMKREGKWKPK